MNRLLVDAFQATAILLVFVTTLFGMRYSVIRNDLEKEYPLNINGMRRERNRLTSSLMINCIPVMVLNAMVSYLFLPQVVEVIGSSHFSFWNFDFIPTAFVLVALWVWVFFTWSLWLVVKMYWKIRKVGREIRTLSKGR